MRQVLLTLFNSHNNMIALYSTTARFCKISNLPYVGKSISGHSPPTISPNPFPNILTDRSLYYFTWKESLFFGQQPHLSYPYNAEWWHQSGFQSSTAHRNKLIRALIRSGWPQLDILSQVTDIGHKTPKSLLSIF